MNKPATPLSSGLISKGSAAPTSVDPSLAKSAATQLAKTAVTYKAMTVKLDEQRYRALKTAGLDLDLSSQQILVQALDLWLERRESPAGGAGSNTLAHHQ
ncbi:hypothetical protein ABT392_00385 [Paucibacter sp. JuS9]|uniref:hypothetical protein n=1 Tax=Paucibacter sp. JuS9 TaxID=3228748 RepID=UPI003756F8A6